MKKTSLVQEVCGLLSALLQIERWTSEGYWSLEGPQVSFRAKIIAVNTLASKEVIDFPARLFRVLIE